MKEDRKHDGQDEFEMPDAVFPTVATVYGSADVYIEQNRIRMREESVAPLSVGVANRDIKNPDGPVVTIHADLSENAVGRYEDDDIYTELALTDIQSVRKLRDALDAVIEYREDSERA